MMIATGNCIERRKMKNIRNNQLKTCIYLTAEEFTDIVGEILDNVESVEYALDGFIVYTTDDVADVDELHEALRKYFGVKEIESVHTDHCEYVGVWIVYKN